MRGCHVSFLVTHQHKGEQRQQRGPPERESKHAGLQRDSAEIRQLNHITHDTAQRSGFSGNFRGGVYVE